MPFDPTIPFKVDLPEPHRPIERYLTLRGMMDQRRGQEMQLRRAELQERQALEEQQEVQGIRELFRSNPKPTPADIYRVAPTKGTAVLKGLYEQDTQERAAAKAREDLAAAVAKNKKDRQVILRNRQFALLQEPDEAKRQRAWSELAPELVELELSSPEDAANPAPDLPTLERMAGQYFTATEGPEKYQEYQTKILTERDRRTKAALEESLKKIELAGHYAGTVRDQPSYERWTSMLPVELRTVLDKDYTPQAMQKAQDAMLTAQQRAQQTTQQATAAALDSPDKVIEWMNQPGRTPEELERGKQMLGQMVKYRQDVRPVLGTQDTGGLVASVMKNPAVFNQLPAEMKGALLPALTAAGFQPPPPEEFRKQSLAIENIRNALAQYRTHLESYSPLVRPGTPTFAKLQTAYRNLQLRAKDAFQLGALTGPDMQLLNETLGDPTSLAGRYGGKETLTAQIDEFGAVLKSNEEALRRTYNQTAPQQSPPSGQSAAPGRIPNPIVGPGGKSVVRWGKDAQGNPVRLP